MFSLQSVLKLLITVNACFSCLLTNGIYGNIKYGLFCILTISVVGNNYVCQMFCVCSKDC